LTKDVADDATTFEGGLFLANKNYRLKLSAL